MKTEKQERRGWMAYALAAGFVLLASGAALPDTSASVNAVVNQIRALFA